MGLTIHYDLKTDLKNAKDVRQLVEAIRQHALDLPFAEVGEVKEFKGAEATFEVRDDPDRFLKLASALVVPDGLNLHGIPASHIIAFLTMPGEGSDPAIFDFCKYPAEAMLPSGKKMATERRDGAGQRFARPSTLPTRSVVASRTSFGAIWPSSSCSISSRQPDWRPSKSRMRAATGRTETSKPWRKRQSSTTRSWPPPSELFGIRWKAK